jgi:hypothetical protein
VGAIWFSGAFLLCSSEEHLVDADRGTLRGADGAQGDNDRFIAELEATRGSQVRECCKHQISSPPPAVSLPVPDPCGQ